MAKTEKIRYKTQKSWLGAVIAGSEWGWMPVYKISCKVSILHILFSMNLWS